MLPEFNLLVDSIFGRDDKWNLVKSKKCTRYNFVPRVLSLPQGRKREDPGKELGIPWIKISLQVRF